jgi:diguanylate cyclase (GGDEF)-like protein
LSYQTTLKDLALILRADDIDRLLDGADPSAHLDPLTGLASRRHFIEFLDALLSEASDQQPQLALILLDLDDFKTANDNFGPEVCDAVLCRVAQRLRIFAQAASLIARVSGDGFAIVLQHPSAAQELAEKCHEFIGRTYVVNGHIVTIDTSIGIAKAGIHGHSAATCSKQRTWPCTGRRPTVEAASAASRRLSCGKCKPMKLCRSTFELL